MPGCKVSEKLLGRDDGQGHKVRDWGCKQADYILFCRICISAVNLSKKGFQAVEQHVKTREHMQQVSTKLDPQQLRLTASTSNSGFVTRSSESTVVGLHYALDDVIKAELVWLLKMVASDYSMSSCNGTGDTLKAMFDCPVAAKFTMERSKASYLLTDALAPHFRDLQKEAMAGQKFTIIYDETTNKAGYKEMHVIVRYWSEKHGRVVKEHLQTFFLKKAQGVDIKAKICEALDNASLSLCNLLMLGSDGPNVSKTVLRLLKEEVKLCRLEPLLHFGFCNIHNLHNGFLKGLESLGEDVAQLVIKVYLFFKGWPSRWQDFETIQEQLKLPDHHFIKHCNTRWLTLEGAASRLLEQWDGLIEYFLKFLPKKKNSKLHEKQHCREIMKLLQDPPMKAKLMFVISSAEIFTKFTGFFQREEPLIHLLHSMLSELIQVLIGRACKKSLDYDKVFERENLLAATNVVVSTEIHNELTNSRLSEKEKLLFLNSARNHYVDACRYILKTSSFLSSHKFLKACTCLRPDQRTRVESIVDIVVVAKAMPWKISTDRLSDEWKLLQLEDLEEGSTTGRIDLYWSQFFSKRTASGELKYIVLSKLVKSILSLSHGQADVERDFSVSGRILTCDRTSMNERTLNAYMNVKSALRIYNNKPYLVPISKDLLAGARCANQNYRAYLENERMKKEEVQRKEKEEESRLEEEKKRTEQMEKDRMTISKKEEKLKQLREEEGRAAASADKLLQEANDRLKKAIASKNLTEISVAQAMIEGVTNIRKNASAIHTEVSYTEKIVKKRQSELINNLRKKHKS